MWYITNDANQRRFGGRRSWPFRSDFTYRYPFASSIGLVEGELGVNLATCDARCAHPHFFSGRMRQPKVVGDMLLALCQVVRTHFFIARPPRLDPVVTSNPQMLRFEGFSGCCGVYAGASICRPRRLTARFRAAAQPTSISTRRCAHRSRGCARTTALNCTLAARGSSWRWPGRE